MGHTQSQQLRTAWKVLMPDVTAEQPVFLEESIFKQRTGLRCTVYAPIGNPVRSSDDIRRGDTWSILPAYTMKKDLPCTQIRQGYLNQEALFD